MKTITITFKKNGSVVATATAEFRSLPGKGRMTWTGNLEPHLIPPFQGVTRHNHHYAELFEGAMVNIAEKCSLEVTVEKVGDWLVFYE